MNKKNRSEGRKTRKNERTEGWKRCQRKEVRQKGGFTEGTIEKIFHEKLDCDKNYNKIKKLHQLLPHSVLNVN